MGVLKNDILVEFACQAKFFHLFDHELHFTSQNWIVTREKITIVYIFML
jgi:hypothetical protein